MFSVEHWHTSPITYSSFLASNLSVDKHENLQLRAQQLKKGRVGRDEEKVKPVALCSCVFLDAFCLYHSFYWNFYNWFLFVWPDAKKACFNTYCSYKLTQKTVSIYTCGFDALLTHSCIFIIMAFLHKISIRNKKHSRLLRTCKREKSGTE